jgi:drug/metabolite transporter (DMT)-like permease
MLATSHRLRLALAFFAIYVLWGSTYLAIRVLVATVPPLFAAGVRFSIAGIVLYAWSRARGVPEPSRLEWRNLSILAALLFLAAYSGLFWAEKTLPSGIASVLVATVPVWVAAVEIFVFRRQAFRWLLVAALAVGLGGVALMAFDGASGLSPLPCLVILCSDLAWSLGTVLTPTLALPKSKALTAGAEMMLGGLMLLVSSALARELSPWPHVSPRAAAALAYLIVAGSLIAFTAYQWLLAHVPATIVTSYAYVNPVVAILIGYGLGHETLSLRIVLGSALVLSSVIALVRGGGTTNEQRTTHNEQQRTA